MQTGEVLRREVFNLLDAAKGGRLKKLKEVNKHEIVEGVTEDYMERRVQTLLSYVKQHSPYYKEHPEWTKLEDFPVMTKGDFIEHYDEVLVDCVREQGNLYRLSTSGSTGTPFTVLCDGDKMSRVNMNFISCMELNGFYRLDHAVTATQKTILDAFGLSEGSVRNQAKEIGKIKENAMNQFYTAESVTEGHPDKLCDLIADSVLDECLSHDALSRVACEVMATRGQIIVAGEITSLYEPSIPSIVRSVLRKVGYNPARFAIQCLIHKQSPDIAAGVDCSLEQRRNVDGSSPSLQLGAGDQGIMVGYACSETPQMLPLPVVLAHRLTSALTIARKSGAIQGLRPDGKAQVTVEYDEDGKPFRLDTVVLSAQHSPEIPADELCFELTDKVIAPALQVLPPDEDTKILINPAGRFVLGGPEADTGLTGRKLMVDSFGVFAPHGGGAFSGKDATKVDRSGAYMARYIAKNLVAAGLCERCQVTLAYAIGAAQPVMVEVDTFKTGTVCADDCLADAVKLVFGLTPAEIIAKLDLLSPRYTGTAAYGHFGRPEFPWERTDQAKILRAAVI